MRRGCRPFPTCGLEGWLGCEQNGRGIGFQMRSLTFGTISRPDAMVRVLKTSSFSKLGEK